MGRVLVIDDDPGVRESFRAVLESAGHTVTTADGGAEGIESARANRPDLVFLDLKMPGLSGVDTLAQLNESCPGLPVYIVTGFHREFLDALRELESRGIDFNLARKPLTVSEIQLIATSRLDEVRAPVSSHG